MKKPIIALSLMLLGATAVCAQTSKGRNMNAPAFSYAKVPAPANVETYKAFTVATESSVLPFTEDEFESSINLQGFTKVSRDTETADISFAMNGLSADDLKMTTERSKLAKEYRLSIVPRPDAAFRMLLMAHGKATQFYEIPVRPKMTDEKKVISESIVFSFDEAEKYLIFYGEDKADPTPYLVEQYLKQLFGEEYLTETVAPMIHDLYDNRVNIESTSFYFLKEKKNDPLKEETKAKLEELEKVAASLNTIEKLRAGKSQLDPFVDYYTAMLADYDVSEKSTRKAGWGLLMNLHELALMQEDYTAAAKYMQKALETGERKWVTKIARNVFNDVKEEYALNYDSATGERTYAAEYVKDPLLEAIAEKDNLKGNNLKDVPGYVLKDDGTKMEGKLSLAFYTSPEESSGNMISLDGDQTAKKVVVKYLNEKGKTRYKDFKCKNVTEIVADGKVYEPVNPKVSFLDIADNALSIGNLSSNIFMLRVFKTESIGLFKDLTENGGYYFRLPGVKKAETANAEFFAGCPALAKRIEAGEFSDSEEDQIKIAEAYAASCGSGSASK